MINNYVLDIGRNTNQRYELNLNNETAVVIAGYTNVGKTNLIEYLKSQLLLNSCEIYSYNKRNKYFDTKVQSQLENRIFTENKFNKILTSLKSHKKEIERRKKLVEKSKLNYIEYINEKVKEEDTSKWIDRILIIDDFSIHLTEMKITNKIKFDEYMEVLKFIIEEGHKFGYRLFIVGLRCKNGDIPNELVNLITCKIIFSNAKSDFIDWGFVSEGLKYPKKIGELLIKSNSSEEIHFVKTYDLDSYINESRYIFEKIKY